VYSECSVAGEDAACTLASRDPDWSDPDWSEQLCFALDCLYGYVPFLKLVFV